MEKDGKYGTCTVVRAAVGGAAVGTVLALVLALGSNREDGPGLRLHGFPSATRFCLPALGLGTLLGLLLSRRTPGSPQLARSVHRPG